ncbi:MAG: 50S ribosomal protein L18 [Omnitrophica WOR_2 bacterium RIFCSPHIGHO2_02_FULL_50_17]|nr:MAG: 50S ribosomal protein L18 [Omnitrophica WOR_2 bacterium RIFCSPHIGHO2_02_FULL_50_17]
MVLKKELTRMYRHGRIRKKLSGTGDRPRVCVYRSLKHFYVQAIDDTAEKVLFGLSTRTKDLRPRLKDGGNVDAAAQLGELFAAAAQKKGIRKVCLDRSGYLYHGRVKAFAEAARKGGMEF